MPTTSSYESIINNMVSNMKPSETYSRIFFVKSVIAKKYGNNPQDKVSKIAGKRVYKILNKMVDDKKLNGISKRGSSYNITTGKRGPYKGGYTSFFKI